MSLLFTRHSLCLICPQDTAWLLSRPLLSLAFLVCSPTLWRRRLGRQRTIMAAAAEVVDMAMVDATAEEESKVAAVAVGGGGGHARLLVQHVLRCNACPGWVGVDIGLVEKPFQHTCLHHLQDCVVNGDYLAI
jgi:hypothetical protein